MTNRYDDIVPIGHPDKSHRVGLRASRRKFRLSWVKLTLIVLVIMIIPLIIFRSSIMKKWQEFNYKRGMENLSKGNFGKAAGNFEIAANGENEIDALYKLAVSKYNQKDFEGAIAAYQKVLEKDPKYPLGYNGLGNLYRDQKNYDKAEENYKKAIENDNSFTIAYSNWAIMLIDNGQPEQAKKVIADGLEKNPQSVELSNLKNILNSKN